MLRSLRSGWPAIVVATLLGSSIVVAQPGEVPGADDDSRLGPLRSLRDKLHPWEPPTTKAEWERERAQIRERLLVSNGLWPLPPRTPLQPTVYGKVERDDYTIERVYFASRPGHYVTGSLYRPKNAEGKRPGVLCPHGHWANGRFYDAGTNTARDQIAQGAETRDAAARFPLQARFVQLARMGCVVFHYDMVGYADSRVISHRQQFNDAEAALWLVNKMGLQTWNSIRALDFLSSLPDVDASRLAVTGASGGGTQTFVLCALDPRPAVCFPAVMVSTNMQGGCVCENASYLRIGVNNIAFAALAAPRPMALSGADDWTIDIERLGLPELKQVYSLYGKGDLVNATALPQFKHNYNEPSRQMMYHWFNRHLKLGLDEPIRERDFRPASIEEMTVFTTDQPTPDDAAAPERLRGALMDEARAQYASLLPEGRADLERYRTVVGTAARVMFDPEVRDDETITVHRPERGGDGVPGDTVVERSRGSQKEVIPIRLLRRGDWDGAVVIWVTDGGPDELADDPLTRAAVQELIGNGRAVVGLEYLLSGRNAEELAAARPLDRNYPGLTLAYNRPLLVERVRDVLTVLKAAEKADRVTTVHLVGTGRAGPVALLARALTDVDVGHTLVDLSGFSFSRVQKTDDPMFLPGALRYGDIGGLAALAVPANLSLYGTKDVPSAALAPLRAAASAAGSELKVHEEPLDSGQLSDLLP